ncbi:hypothetical protein ElyMa_003447000 [Elysia marginata]|uniref:Tantalus-like domain-containing protein n=1 Tax=Elysia marginata TaxID=1093978 RepID=A0AAV4JVA0_9GAST|nr:hypothetical protein ElyMa_003447000 [Elysia marginata]
MRLHGGSPEHENSTKGASVGLQAACVRNRTGYPEAIIGHGQLTWRPSTLGQCEADIATCCPNPLPDPSVPLLVSSSSQLAGLAAAPPAGEERLTKSSTVRVQPSLGLDHPGAPRCLPGSEHSGQEFPVLAEKNSGEKLTPVAVLTQWNPSLTRPGELNAEGQYKTREFIRERATIPPYLLGNTGSLYVFPQLCPGKSVFGKLANKRRMPGWRRSKPKTSRALTGSGIPKLKRTRKELELRKGNFTETDADLDPLMESRRSDQRVVEVNKILGSSAGFVLTLLFSSM